MVEIDLNEDGEYYSDEDDRPAMKTKHKAELLEWVTKADFSKEISLASIAKQRFKLDDDERDSI